MPAEPTEPASQRVIVATTKVGSHRHVGQTLTSRRIASFPQRSEPLDERRLASRLQMSRLDSSSVSLQHPRETIQRLEGGCEHRRALKLGDG
jgi:hypothetical protein